jgi:hypothetical protein
MFVVLALLWVIVLFVMLIIWLVRRGKDKALAKDIAEAADTDPADEAVRPSSATCATSCARR